MAKILGLKINKIKLLAIGFNAEIDNLDYTSSIKEFFIVIAGPLTYFLSLLILKYLYNIDFLSHNAYIQAQTVNEYTLVFNLLPILPLDGGRLFKILIDNFLTCKKSMILTVIFSNAFMILFMYYTRYTPQWLMYIFLLITNIMYILNINKNWKLFLIDRLTFINKYKKRIHYRHDIYRNRDNYVIMENRIYTEKEAVMKFIKDN